MFNALQEKVMRNLKPRELLLLLVFGSIPFGNFIIAFKTAPTDAHPVSTVGLIFVAINILVSCLSTVNILYSVIVALLAFAFYRIDLAIYFIILCITACGIHGYCKGNKNGAMHVATAFGVSVYFIYMAARFYYFDSYFYLLMLFPFVLVVTKGFLMFNLNYSSRLKALDAVVFFVVLLMVQSSFLFAFSFDDLNNYLWAPKSFVNGIDVFNKDNPATPTFLSAYSFSTNYIAAIFGVDVIGYNLRSKFLNLGVYLFAFSWYLQILRQRFEDSWRLPFLISITAPFVAYELSGNFSDVTILIAGLYVLDKIVKRDPEVNRFDMVFCCVWALVNFKTIPVVISFWLARLIVNKSATELKNLALIVASVLIGIIPILVLNYIDYGNPTFPANNHFWKSAYFIATKGDKIADKFIPQFPIDLNYFYNIFNVDPVNHLKSYWGGFNGLYGFSLAIVFFIMCASFFDMNLSAEQTFLLLLIGLYLLLVTKLTGPEHRYFAAVLFFMPYYLGVRLSETDFLQRSIRLIVWLGCFLSFVYSFNNVWYNFNLIHSTKYDLLYTHSNSRWVEKIEFYAKVNKIVGHSDSVLMHYLQDRLYLNAAHIYEYDWYSYPVQETIAKLLQRPKSELVGYLVDLNIKYLLITNGSNFLDGLVRDHCTVTVRGLIETLYSCDFE